MLIFYVLQMAFYSIFLAIINFLSKMFLELRRYPNAISVNNQSGYLLPLMFKGHTCFIRINRKAFISDNIHSIREKVYNGLFA